MIDDTLNKGTLGTKHIENYGQRNQNELAEHYTNFGVKLSVTELTILRQSEASPTLPNLLS